MNFNFVYSAGGGAGDWNGINRVWIDSMPIYFKDNLLIKFGDIFFNHRSARNIIKPSLWREINNARNWLINKTNDKYLLDTENLILDVGTSKIVSFITHHNSNMTGQQIIVEFDRILSENDILDKYCSIINDSKIVNAVTFDIPNLFKVRTQSGNTKRNLFNEPGCRAMLISEAAKYSNYIFDNTGRDPNKLLTFISAQWSSDDIDRYLNILNYCPSKLSIGGLIDYPLNEYGNLLIRLNEVLSFSNYNKVHFLGGGGIKRSRKIIDTLGNLQSFSVDNTTAFNRAIDGNKTGTSMSKYIDYCEKKLISINNDNRDIIIELHRMVPDGRNHFSVEEMISIIDSILEHQSGNSSNETYNNRAKLAIHNFDVFKYNLE